LFAPVDLSPHPKTVVQPDICFIRSGRTGVIASDNSRLLGVPDLIIEVLSPSTRDYDQGEKMEKYASMGVGELWIVDHQNITMEKLERGDVKTFKSPIYYGEKDQVESVILPGFKLNLSEI